MIALAILTGCAGKVSLANLGPQQLFDRGLEAYNDEDYLDAIEYFQTIVYNFPGESIVDTAQYYLGLSYFGNEDFLVAQTEFNRLVMNYPSSPYFVNALFMRAVSFYESTPDHYGLDQSELRTAIKQLEDFMIDYPESELVDEAELILAEARDRLAHKYYEAGKVYDHIRAYGAAKKYFQKVVDDYTNSEWAVKSAFELARMEYKQGNFDEASRRFENFARVYSDHEQAEKARERALESAFAWAKKAYDAGLYDQARERLQAFTEKYSDSDLADEAQEYLQKLKEKASEQGVAHDSTDT
jgi:outer membrane protein assembly factor BamD